MFFYAFLGIIFEMPLFYFAIPAKERRPELFIFIILLNLITWSLSLTVGRFLPYDAVTILMVVLSGIGEGAALKMIYAKSMTMKRALIMGVVVNLVAFLFVRLFIAVMAM